MSAQGASFRRPKKQPSYIAAQRKGMSMLASAALAAAAFGGVTAASLNLANAETAHAEEIQVQAESGTQRLTFGVKVDGDFVRSDGDNSTAEELPESLRDLKVTLTAEDGTQFVSSADAAGWVGKKGSPVMRNFAGQQIPYGTYTVSISGADDVANDQLALKADSQLRDGATIEVNGKVPNLFVEFETVKVELPNWEDGSTKPGESAELPNIGGEVTEGTTVEAAGPGEAELKDDGTIVVTPSEDAKPGDEIKVTVKDPEGNVIDEITITIEAPVELPDWEDGSTKPGETLEIPNTGGEVPGDITVETDGPGEGSVNEDGTLVVTPNDDAKPGDKITVTVKDENGDVIDTVVVEIVEDGNGGEQTEQPNWEDGSTTPGNPIEIPNTGGEVEDGTTVEVEGPGDAELKEDGTIVVTPSEDAKPGDTITVTVKDKDGNVIDTITITLDKPADNGTGNGDEGQSDDNGANNTGKGDKGQSDDNGSPLATTGAEGLGWLAGLTAALMAIGAAVMRFGRRRNTDES